MSVPSEIVLRAEGVSKSFPGVKALDDVQLTLRRGQLTALLGENGAGKSTLMNILAGVLQPDHGRIQIEGRETRFASPKDAQNQGIAMIFQELNLMANLTVAENIFLGREPLTRFGFIDTRRMRKEAAAWLEKLELDVSPDAPLDSLRVGQQQIVEIAKALSLDARVLIMDEPTSAISDHEVAVLFRVIRELKQRGIAIAYITHKLNELAEIGDTAVIMRDGRWIAEEPLQRLDRDQIVRLMVGRDLSELFQKTNTPTSQQRFRVENLSLSHPQNPTTPLLDDISFSVQRGEVLGIFGLMGAGRTELLECLFGLHPQRCSGDFRIDGEPYFPDSPRRAIEAGLALAPEDRKQEGLVLEMSVSANASLPRLKALGRYGILDTNREKSEARDAVRRLGIKTPSIGQRVRNLSGGNQQKVVLAKWLATEPKVILLDEPTRGIDINAKKEIYTLVDRLAKEGLSVVIVSSELPEIMAISDRIAVLSEGRLTAEFSREDATQESLMSASLPQQASF